jgi:endonuclease/exonuclease/phosphatase family metal-dependent hydrolase
MRVATFNVKDLLLEQDGAPSPVFEAKVTWIAQEIARANVDLVGLQELGGQRAFEALRAALPGYDGIMGTVDDRGIGCAILARVPLTQRAAHTTDTLPFPVFHAGDPPPFPGRLGLRRAIVEARFATPHGEVSVFCTHLKSNLPRRRVGNDGTDDPFVGSFSRGEGHIRSAVVRAAEALYLRGLVDACEAAHVVVLGDLNDDAKSLALKVLYGDRESATALSSCMFRVPEHKRYTTLHGGRPSAIDHILVTPGLREFITDANIRNGDLVDHPMPGPGIPVTVESDHALYWVELGL